MEQPALLLQADRIGRRYGVRPSAILLDPDGLAVALDLAALQVGVEEDERQVALIRPMAVWSVGG